MPTEGPSEDAPPTPRRAPSGARPPTNGRPGEEGALGPRRRVPVDDAGQGPGIRRARLAPDPVEDVSPAVGPVPAGATRRPARARRAPSPIGPAGGGDPSADRRRLPPAGRPPPGPPTAPVHPVVLDAGSLLDDVPARRPAPAPRPGRATSNQSEPPPVAIAVPTRRQRKAAQRLQARKVGRLIRHVDPWSVLKVALLANLCLFTTLLVSGTLLWSLARGSGLLEGVEGFIAEAFALTAFEFHGPTIFRVAVLGGLAAVAVASAAAGLAAAVFNLISDLVGGIRVTVVEEETARPVPLRD